MRKLEEINQEYSKLCTQLGDITVKIKGLENYKASIFQSLAKLDEEAAQIHKLMELKKQEEEQESANEKE